ncbi:MAG: transcriptional repressor LexA [Dethiobacter sp.]|nr:transcriptional repressor LexA [Dethiobacter sp.]
MEALDPRESQVLEFIEKEVARCNYPPSVREIGKAVGIPSTSTVHNCLASLESKGYIRRSSTLPRAIELLKSEISGPAKRCFFAPLVGAITAGRPILAEENLEGYFPLPAEVAPGGNCFVLKVQGDSMIGAGIQNGDYVVIRRQKTAHNGEIVAALLGDEATVKRFFLEGDYIRLQPENEAYQPIKTREAVILGKVVAIYRRL